MFSFVDNFCDFLFHEKRYSVNTVISYKNDIRQFIEYVTIEYEITQFSIIKHIHIRSWLVTLMEKEITPKSINRKISTLRTFFSFLRRKGEVSKNPMLKIQAPKIPKRLPEYIREDAMERLFDNLNEDLDYPSYRDVMLVELLYSTGMRRAELIGLKWSDLDASNNQLKVLGKGDKERLIPVSQRMIEKLNKLQDLGENTFKHYDRLYVFLTNKGKQIYPKLVYTIVKRMLSLVSTSKKKSPHILRHSFATHLTNNGADINAIKELLGHANLGATQIYTHNSIAKLREVYKSTHPKAKKG